MFCVVSFEFVDHGGRQGNTAQALAQWRHPVASSEALAVLHQGMCPTSYHHICMAIKIAGQGLRRIDPAAAMADKLVETTQKSNKTHFLASNYGTF